MLIKLQEPQTLQLIKINKNCALFTNCMSKINNAHVHDAQDIDRVMPMYNLIEYCDVYLKTSRSL